MKIHLLPISLLLTLGCGNEGETTDSGTAPSETGTPSDTGGTTFTPTDCADAVDHIDEVVCALENFLAGLDANELATARLAMTDSASKTQWSNLPGVSRAGIAFGDLSTESRTQAMAVAEVLLSEEGYEDLVGILASDDYLGTQSGGGGGQGGAQYSSDNAHIAVFGTPDASGDFMVMIGNHHMAFNVTYVAGTGYPVPHHAGVEPKGTFTVNGESHAPLDDDGAAMFAVFDALDSAQLAEAHLSGQVFGDVVLGPVEYGSGSLSAVDYPTQEGLAVSSLDTAQQALVTAAIEAWVGTFAAETSDALVADYVAAYDDTTIAFGGDSGGPELNTSGSYMRIDGPRVWIEVAMQSGVVLQGTHYHTIYRDKSYDYGAAL